MDEHDDDVVTVNTDTVPAADNETLIEQLDAQGLIEGSLGEGEGEEIMVEVVDSDVFVDGVGGEDQNGETGVDERELGAVEGEGGVVVDLWLREDGDARIETRVESVHEIAGSSGDGDVVAEEVKSVVNEEGMERCDELSEGGDVSGVFSTPSGHEEACVMNDVEALNCGTETGVQDTLVDTGLLSEETQVTEEEVTVLVSEEGKERNVESVDEVAANQLASESGVLSGEALNNGIEAVVARSSMIEHPRTTQTQVISEQVPVVVKEEGLNCDDNVLHEDPMEIKSPSLEKDQSTSIGMVDVETGADAMRANVDFKDQQIEAVDEEDLLVNKEDSLHLKLKVTKSDIIDESLQCSIEDGQMKDGMLDCIEFQNVKCETSCAIDGKDVEQVAVSEIGVMVARAETTAMDDKEHSNIITGVSEGNTGLGEHRNSNLSIVSGSATKDDVAMTYTELRGEECGTEFLAESLVTEHQVTVGILECDALDGNPCSMKEEETAGGSTIADGVVCKDPYLCAGVIDTSVTGKSTLEEDVSREYDPEKSLNELTTDEISNEEASDVALPQIVDQVSCGPEAFLSSESYHSEGKPVHSCVTDLTSHLTDGNRNSEVDLVRNDNSLIDEDETKAAYVSEGVTSSEIVNLSCEAKVESGVTDDKQIVFSNVHEEKDSKMIDNESFMGALIETMGTCPSEEVKKPQVGHFEGNDSLPASDANSQGIEGDLDLQFSECLDGKATVEGTGFTSDLECKLGVQECFDEVQDILHKEQGAELEDQIMEIERSKVNDEKIPEQVSPEPDNSRTEGHSSYLLPPKNEGEFSVSDLVWGKVRSHPWWPGQIFDPADASEKAVKYHKKDCFLVAYFGDRTFAWNDASLLRPFQTHFSQIEKQSNSEAFHHAVSSALAEVSRRVELGLACSCIPKDALEEIESQIVENTGIHQRAGRRYGVDESTGVACFEPDRLVQNVRLLALLPTGGGDRLELAIAKAQLSAFSRFKGAGPLPEFQLCGGLSEIDANASNLSEVIEQHSEQIKGENISSNKRKHESTDSLHPRKKEKSMSELMGDMQHSSDGEDEPDGKIVDNSFTSSTGRKRKALDSVSDGSDKRISFYAAKVSTTVSPIPKPSFKVGERISRLASQLTGSPSLLKCNSEKFLKVDNGVDQHDGFDDPLQTPGNSQRGRVNLSSEQSSVDEMLSQLHLAARDPMKGYSFLSAITTFFSGFRQSIALAQNSRRQNSSTGRGGRKRKASHAIINSPEEFEFDDVNDSYWTDRIVQNYAEEQLVHNAQNGEGEYHQLVAYEPDKPLKSVRKSRKRFSGGDLEMQAEEPAEHVDEMRQDCSPTELILNFTEGNSVPSESNLNKIFKRFGPLRESETEVDRQTSRARVVFKRCSDAEVAFSSAGKFNIFGSLLVNYELSYVSSTPFKSLPFETLQTQEDAS